MDFSLFLRKLKKTTNFIVSFQPIYVSNIVLLLPFKFHGILVFFFILKSFKEFVTFLFFVFKLFQIKFYFLIKKKEVLLKRKSRPI